MSGETEEHPFGWTLDSLKSHLTALIAAQEAQSESGLEELRRIEVEREKRFDERDRRYEERYEAQQTASRVALQCSDKEFREYIRQIRRETEIALANVDKAMTKSEAANEKRFEAVNEFRAQLTDQATTFMPRREIENMVTSLSEKVSSTVTRVELGATRADLASQVASASAAIEGVNQSALARTEAALQRVNQMAEDIIALKLFQNRVAGLEEQVKLQKERLDKTEGHGSGSQALWGYIVGAVGLILAIVTLANVLTGQG